MVEQAVVLYVLKLFWSPKQRAVNETFRFASLSAVLHKGGGSNLPSYGQTGSFIYRRVSVLHRT